MHGVRFDKVVCINTSVPPQVTRLGLVDFWSMCHHRIGLLAGPEQLSPSRCCLYGAMAFRLVAFVIGQPHYLASSSAEEKVPSLSSGGSDRAKPQVHGLSK
jgi:hypothetical protein